MSKNIFKVFILFSLIIFIIFIYIFFVAKDIINIPSFRFLNYMDRGKKYWYYYLNLQQDGDFVGSIYFVNYILNFLLVCEFLFISLNEKYKDFVSVKEILISFFVMLILYFVQKYITYNYIYDNKLYMIFYPTLIGSTGILYLSIKILKRIDKKKS